MTDPTRGKSELVRISGRTIRLHREGSGEPLLLLNGLTRPLESWRPLARALKEQPHSDQVRSDLTSNRTLISFDAPGVGLSPTPTLPLSIRRLARLAAAVLDYAGFATADVLGFSHGGAIAQQLAIDSPQRVRRLVLGSTSCGIGATPGDQTLLRHLRNAWEPADWPRSDALGTWWHLVAISQWSSIPFLGAIAMPTLVICGARDGVIPPANGRLLAERIPGAHLVLLPVGHDLQPDSSATLLAGALDQFLVNTDTSMRAV